MHYFLCTSGIGMCDLIAMAMEFAFNRPLTADDSYQNFKTLEPSACNLSSIGNPISGCH